MLRVSQKQSWQPVLDTELEQDITRLVLWDGITEQDLAGKDVANCGAAELAGEAPLLGLALSEPALLWRCTSFWVRRLTAQVSLSRVKPLSPVQAGQCRAVSCSQQAVDVPPNLLPFALLSILWGADEGGQLHVIS